MLTPRTRCLLPVLHAGELAGTFGDAAAFSLYPTKVLSGYGDRGVIGRRRRNLSGSVSRACCRKRTVVTGLPAAEPG